MTRRLFLTYLSSLAIPTFVSGTRVYDSNIRHFRDVPKNSFFKDKSGRIWWKFDGPERLSESLNATLWDSQLSPITQSHFNLDDVVYRV